MLTTFDSLKKLTLGSALLAAIGVACSSAPQTTESASDTSEATIAVHPTCATPYIAVCDATGASCHCQIDPAASPTLPAKDIAAASSTTYLIKTDGTVWGWGAAGEADGFPMGPILPGDTNGNQFPDAVTVPMAVGVSNAVQLAAGTKGACALLGNGTVSCWGTLLGGDSQTPTLVRVKSPSAVLSNVASISHGNAHVCALLNDATIQCWGDNRFGQLGNGTADGPETDAVAMKVWPVTQGLTATQVVAAGNTTCVRYSNGSVFCIGENTQGQLGIGSHNDVLPNMQPQPVQSIANVDMLFGGGLGTFCVHEPKTATTAESTLCWGDDENNQLDGEDAHDAYSPHAHEITTVGQATRAFSDYNGCAWSTDGAPTCWGSTAYHLFNAGTDTTKQVLPMSSIVQIAIGDDHACAISRRGVTCWGQNDKGQLGTGTTADVSGPTAVSNIPTTDSQCTYGTRAISCGSSGNGLNADNCHCPVCVPLTSDDVCGDSVCGTKPNGCGGHIYCGPCARTCPPGFHSCGDDGCVKGRCF